MGGNLRAGRARRRATSTVNTTVYNNIGTQIPLQLQFTRTADGWSLQASSNGQNHRRTARRHLRRDRRAHEPDITLAETDLDNMLRHDRARGPRRA